MKKRVIKSTVVGSSHGKLVQFLVSIMPMRITFVGFKWWHFLWNHIICLLTLWVMLQRKLTGKVCAICDILCIRSPNFHVVSKNWTNFTKLFLHGTHVLAAPSKETGLENRFRSFLQVRAQKRCYYFATRSIKPTNTGLLPAGVYFFKSKDLASHQFPAWVRSVGFLAFQYYLPLQT